MPCSASLALALAALVLPITGFADDGEGSVDEIMMQVVEDPEAAEGEFVDRVELPEPAREALSREPGRARGQAAAEAARQMGESAREASEAVRGGGRPPGVGRAGERPGRPDAPGRPDRPGRPDDPGPPDNPGQPETPGSNR